MLVGFVVVPMLVSVPGLTLLYVCVLWCSGGEGEKRTENRGVSVRGGKRKEKEISGGSGKKETKKEGVASVYKARSRRVIGQETD